MATIRKRGEFSYHVQIRRKGQQPVTKTFNTQKEAEAWARMIESEMDRGIFQDRSTAESTTLYEVITLFAQNVLPYKKSGRSDISRCGLIVQELGHLKMAAVNTVEVTKFREKLTHTYSPSSVKNFLTLLNRIMKYAQIELGIFLPHGLPVAQVKMPKINNQRDRRLEDSEFEKLMANSPRNLQYVILFALETAMRRGEIANLLWSDVNFKEHYAHVRETKNDTPRKVPLTERAFAVLNKLARPINSDARVFAYGSADSITATFRKACDKAHIRDLHFHDLRHEATSRLFEHGLNVIEAATVTGHKELRMLKRYTHLKPFDIAAKLNERRKHNE